MLWRDAVRSKVLHVPGDRFRSSEEEFGKQHMLGLEFNSPAKKREKKKQKVQRVRELFDGVYEAHAIAQAA